MKVPTVIIYGGIGILLFVIIANLVIAMTTPMMVKSAIKATQNQTFTVDGTSYVTVGNGDDASTAAQSARDNANLGYLIVNALAGVALIVVLIIGVSELITHKG